MPRGSLARPNPQFPIVVLVVAVGLVVVCAVDNLNRATENPSPALYWLGITLIVVPVAIRLTQRDVSAGERVALVVVFGMALFAVKVMRDPFAFTLTDEFPHELNVNQILQHRHLYQPNSDLPVTSAFPGLEGATDALASLTGMSAFGSGLMLLAAARLLLILGLYSLFAALSGSSRVAALGVMAYAADSNFVLWEGQFAYESLALPLLIVLLAACVTRGRLLTTERRPWTILLILLILAIVPTHHVTSYVMVFVLAVLSIGRLPRIKRLPRISLENDSSLWPFAVLALAAAGLWLLVVGKVTVGYLSPAVTGAVGSIYHTVTLESPPRALFGGASDGLPGNAAGERLLGLLAAVTLVVVVLAALPGMWTSGRREIGRALLMLAALAAIPLNALRIAPGAWAISVRAEDFVFIGAAFVMGAFPIDSFGRATRMWISQIVVAVGLAVMVVGGMINGWPPASRIARPTQIEANGRTLPAPTFAVGYWMRQLPPGLVVAPDSDASTVLVYGAHRIVTGFGLDADSILEATSLHGWMLRLWRQHGVRYIVADQRADATNATDAYYFGTTEAGGYREAILGASLVTKFDSAGLSRLYDSGNIFVYRLTGVK